MTTGTDHFDDIPFHQYLGLTTEDVQPDYARCRITINESTPKLMAMLAREGRTDLAQACFDFLPVRADLDLLGWEDSDIFAHS